MYKLKGYLFDEEYKPCEILDGINVSDWEEAFTLLKDISIKYYLIALDEIKEGD